MACNCKGRVVTTNPPTGGNCDGCLIINDIRFGCDDGPTPCGETLVTNLAEFNDTTASECDVVYSIFNVSSDDFESVDLTEDGELTVVTNDKFTAHEELEIAYKVDSPCSLLSDVGTVYICLKDLCKGVKCEDCEKCNQCTGECDPDCGNIVVDGGDTEEIKPDLILK